MSKISRNAPCPCGSGKKYKRCCIGQSRPASARRGPRLRAGRHPSYPCLTSDIPGADAGPLALDWLYEHHEDAAVAAYGRMYFAGLQRAEAETLAAIPGEMFTLIDCNGKELLLAEGEIEVDGVEMTCLDLVLGPDGPALSDEQREYLEILGRRHISFYQVVKSRPGRAVAVRDLVDDDEPVRWVEARELSRGRFRKRGRILGARLMPGTPWKASGAFYSTQEPHTSYLLGRIRDGLAENTDPAKVRRIHSQFIVLGWLHGMARATSSYFADAKPGSPPS